MNNKQLFEQSARKILSKNQLEGVMRLHDALFEGQYEEQLADSVANAVSDAVEYTVDTASNDAVEHTIETAIGEDDDTQGLDVSPEDEERIAILLNSMSDKDQDIFLESLDDQQVQVLMEGFGWVKKVFPKLSKYFAKRARNGRLTDFRNLTSKDIELTRQWDNLMNVNGPLSKTSLKELRRLAKQRKAIEQRMNDLRVKAAGNGDEFKLMERDAFLRGSRNVGRETLENIKNDLGTTRDAAIKKANTTFENAKIRLNKKLANKEITRDQYSSELNTAMTKRNRALKAAQEAYERDVKPIEDKIQLSIREGRYAANPNAAINTSANAATAGAQRAGGFTMPHVGGVGHGFASVVRRLPSLGFIVKGTVGALNGFILALKGALVGAVVYGGYKVYDFFTKPKEIDMSLGLEPGSTADTVKKVITALGGGAAGYGIASMLGVDSTAGKAASALLGATLVSYFTYLCGGDETKGAQIFEEYKGATDADQRRINEVLQIDGLGQALQQLYNESQQQ